VMHATWPNAPTFTYVFAGKELAVLRGFPNQPTIITRSVLLA
jgi:hypothetical protein